MVKNIKVIATLGIALNLISCASIYGDNSRKITVKSHPAGAGVYVDGVRYGTTPTVVTLNNYIYGGKVISIKKDGYLDEAAVINTKFQPVGLFNLLFWPGFLIDAATGDTVKVDPETLNVDVDLQTSK